MSEDEEFKFMVGDCVELRSGSPVMTVIDVYETENGAYLQTVWMTEDGEAIYADLPEAAVYMVYECE